MKALLLCGLAVVMSLLPPGRAFPAEVGKGTYEVNFRGNLTTTSSSGTSVSRLVLEPSVGYFVSDLVEVGVTGRLAMGGGLFTRALGFTSLHFERTKTSLYYLGLRAGATGFPEEGNGGLLGAFVGGKVLVADGRAAFIVEPFYLYSIPYDAPKRHSYGISTGLSVFFR